MALMGLVPLVGLVALVDFVALMGRVVPVSLVARLVIWPLRPFFGLMALAAKVGVPIVFSSYLIFRIISF